MKVALKFNLPKEKNEYESAINGSRWQSVVWKMAVYLQRQLKYNNAGEEIEKARIELLKILKDKHLVLE